MRQLSGLKWAEGKISARNKTSICISGVYHADGYERRNEENQDSSIRSRMDRNWAIFSFSRQ